MLGGTLTVWAQEQTTKVITQGAAMIVDGFNGRFTFTPGLLGIGGYKIQIEATPLGFGKQTVGEVDWTIRRSFSLG